MGFCSIFNNLVLTFQDRHIYSPENKTMLFLLLRRVLFVVDKYACIRYIYLSRKHLSARFFIVIICMNDTLMIAKARLAAQGLHNWYVTAERNMLCFFVMGFKGQYLKCLRNMLSLKNLAELK